MTRCLAVLSLAGLLVGCAATDPPAPPRPIQGVSAVLSIRSNDDLALQGWRLDARGQVRGHLVVIHGLKDHSERYLELARRAAQRGFQVFGVDLRGHGRSPGDAAYVTAFTQYVDDVANALQTFRAVAQAPSAPWFLLGHSMGGAIVARYAIERGIDVDGYILSAAALAPNADVGAYEIKAVELLSTVAPHVGALDLPDALFSHDKSLTAAMARDPLVHDERIPARTAAELLANMAVVRAGRRHIKKPTLVLHGTGDLVTNPAGSREFQAAVPRSELKLYPGLYHDLLHEPEHAQVEDDILAWLMRRTAR